MMAVVIHNDISIYFPEKLVLSDISHTLPTIQVINKGLIKVLKNTLTKKRKKINGFLIEQIYKNNDEDLVYLISSKKQSQKILVRYYKQVTKTFINTNTDRITILSGEVYFDTKLNELNHTDHIKLFYQISKTIYNYGKGK